METILERQRHSHEEIERLEQAITDRLLAYPRTIRDRLQLDHETAEMLEKIQLRAHSLRELYADPDSTRSNEIASLSAANGLDAFYSQLASTKDYHKRYPDNAVQDIAAELEVHLPVPSAPADEDDKITKLFSGEESFGRYFDLISLHKDFVNLKRNRTISYNKYLEIFDIFDASAFPPYIKQDPQYVQYLTTLLSYLESFYRRTVPLDEHDVVLKALSDGFEAEWAVDNEEPASVQNNVSQDGIWCNVCQKMYSKQTVYDGHLNSKKHKAGSSKNANNSAGPSRVQGDKKDIARKEWLISKLGLKFTAVKAATKSNVARKQTLTDKEWQAEQQEGDRLSVLPADGKSTAAGEESDEDEDGKIHNPLKLPLGWDGKPIPYWLWRIHGLGKEFPCEICGNHIYMGRKAFDRHFSDAQHLHGLRCLGITPRGSRLFDQITSIDDAVALWERTQGEQRKLEKARDENIEMEDEFGNVMSEKVYKDLVAQGIL